jgi:hypothetical protein
MNKSAILTFLESKVNKQQASTRQFVDTMMTFDKNDYSTGKDKQLSAKTLQITNNKSEDDTQDPADQKVRFINDLGYLGIVFEDLPKLHNAKAKENVKTIFNENDFNSILDKGDIKGWPKFKMRSLYANEEDLITGKGEDHTVKVLNPKSKTLDKETRKYTANKTRHELPYGYINFIFTRANKGKPIGIKSVDDELNRQTDRYIPLQPSHSDLVGGIKLPDGNYAVLVKVSHMEPPILIKMSNEDFNFLYERNGNA